jgi:hypothetical protein
MRLLLDDASMDMDKDEAKSSRPKRAGRVAGVVLER